MKQQTKVEAAEVDRLVAEAVSLMRDRGEIILNAVDQGIYCLDSEGRTIFANEAASRLLGFTLREMVGKPQHELVHHHYADGTPFPREACPIWASVTDGIHQRVGGDTFWRKDGSPLPVDYTSTPIKIGKRIVAVVVTFRDATAEQQSRAQAEKLAAEKAARVEAERGQLALQQAEERTRLALEAGAMGTWEWDIVNGRVIWSPQEERMYGLEEGSFSGTVDEYSERIHPADRQEAFANLRDAMNRKAVSHHVLHRIVRPDGEVRWLDSHGRFVYDENEIPLRLTGVSLDVTERELAAERLRQRDERFAALIAASRQIVWTNSPDGQMQGEQSAWSAFTGQSYEEYQGFGWAKAVHPDDADATVEAWNAAVRARGVFVFEHRLRRHDGVYCHFAIRGVPVLNADGSIREWVGSHTDVTEARAVEAARDRALKDAQHVRRELMRVFEQAPAAIAILEGPTHVFRSANRLYRQLIGNRAVDGLPVREALPEVEEQLITLLDQVYASGEAFVGERVPASVDRGRGIPEPGVFNFVYQPMRDAEGVVTGVLVHATEVTAPLLA